MSTFNPYEYWLGLTGKEKPDTYYELLGLTHGESNIAMIAKRADELLSKVQKMKDDRHFPEWNQILTEIQVAKNCLCNPKYKSEYDAKHPASMASARVMPAMPTMQPGMMPMQGMQPGMMPMQPGMQPGMMPMQNMYGGMPYQQPGMMPMQPGMQPGMMPMQNMYGGVAYPQQGGQPVIQQGIPAQVVPQATPVAVQATVPTPTNAMPTNAPIFTSSPSGAGAKTGTGASRSSTKSASKKHSDLSAVTRNTIAVVGLCIVAFLGHLVYQKHFVNKNNPENAVNNHNQDINVTDFNNGFGNPDFGEFNGGANPAVPAGANLNADAEAAEALSGDFQVPDFGEIRNALAGLEFELARQALVKSNKMTVSPANAQRLERLRLVTEYAERYYKEVETVLERLEPPLELCGGEYGLVEAKKHRAKIRINGKNVSFSMKNPRVQGHNLYEILYRHRFESSVEAGNMSYALGFASIELSMPDGDKELATKLLNRVTEKGTDEDRKTAHHIFEEFNINGLGAMTNQVVAEEATKVAQEATDNATEKEVEGATKEPTETAEQAEEATGKDVEQTGTEEADGTKGASKKNKKKKSSADDAKGGDTTGDADSDADSDAEKKAQAAARHQEEWKQIATSVRQDISWRRIATARRNLTQLEKIAESEAEKNEHYRLKVLTDYTEMFTTWVGNQMGSYQPGTSVRVDGVDVGIVESAPGRLIVRDQGVNRPYTTEDLNPKLVEFLVGKSLQEADDYVLYGTYLAMDAEGDRAKAKTLWKTAVNKGFGKETIDLLLEELEVPLPDAGRRPSSQAQNVRNPRSKTMEPQVIPTGTDREKALEDIKKEFAKDYEKSDMRNQMKLVAKLLKQAQQSDRSSAQAYVMAEEAYRIAISHSYFEDAYAALMIQETRFQRDTYQDRLNMINNANPTARGQSSSSELVDCTLKMVEDAIQRKKKIDANHLLGIARKHQKGTQVKRAQMLEQYLNSMK